MLASPFLTSFLDAYHLSMLYLGYKSFYISSTSLSSGSFFWVLPLSVLNMVPSIFQGVLFSCLSLWRDFCRQVKVFSFFWGSIFLFNFFSSMLVWWGQISIFISTCNFFLLAFWLFLNLVILFIHFFLFPLFIMCMAYFSVLNFIFLSWLYILIASIRVTNSFSFFVNSSISSIFVSWLIFSCDLLNLWLPVHFQNR